MCHQINCVNVSFCTIWHCENKKIFNMLNNFRIILADHFNLYVNSFLERWLIRPNLSNFFRLLYKKIFTPIASKFFVKIFATRLVKNSMSILLQFTFLDLFED